MVEPAAVTKVPAADLEVGHRADECDVGLGRGQRDAAVGALPALVDLEGVLLDPRRHAGETRVA
jgi:hypothetical protein